MAKKESASPVQVDVARGTKTAEDVVGGSEAEGGGSDEDEDFVSHVTQASEPALDQG